MIKFCSNNAEIAALNGTWIDFVASADVFYGNSWVRYTSELSKVTNGGSVAIVEPDFVRSSAIERLGRKSISYFDSGINGFGPERCRKT